MRPLPPYLVADAGNDDGDGGGGDGGSSEAADAGSSNGSAMVQAMRVRWWVEQAAAALDLVDKMVHVMAGLAQPEMLF
jgi:hypothetical protein